jgi:hypothetical protein
VQAALRAEDAVEAGTLVVVGELAGAQRRIQEVAHRPLELRDPRVAEVVSRAQEVADVEGADRRREGAVAGLREAVDDEGLAQADA